jgi:germacradienol/geosmin synthase
VRQFEHIVATELPALEDQFGLDTRAREKLRAYVEKLQRWMAGIPRWHAAVNRYKEFELQRTRSPRTFEGPNGLGTSAARMFRAALRVSNQ